MAAVMGVPSSVDMGTALSRANYAALKAFQGVDELTLDDWSPTKQERRRVACEMAALVFREVLLALGEQAA